MNVGIKGSFDVFQILSEFRGRVNPTTIVQVIYPHTLDVEKILFLLTNIFDILGNSVICFLAESWINSTLNETFTVISQNNMV